MFVTLVPTDGVTVAGAVTVYLEEVRASRAECTLAACEQMLSLFVETYGSKLVGDIQRSDILEHMKRLRMTGISERTVFNHIARINTFLKVNDREKILNPQDWPTYDEKEVSAYTPEELEVLFKVASSDERLLFQFFLVTGFREGEVMHEESGAPPVHSELILRGEAGQTALTRGFTGRLARGVSNELLRTVNRPRAEILPYALQRSLVRNLALAAQKAGRADLLPLWAGQSATLAHHSNVSELLKSLDQDVSLRLHPPH